MIAPCGNPTNANRFGVVPAAVRAHAVPAGLIASSSGSAMLAPIPFKTIRREICFLDIYMSYLRYLLMTLFTCNLTRDLTLKLRRPSHPELIAANNSLDES